MTLSFNKISEKEKRRSLRKNMPKSEVILWSKLKNKQMQGKRFLRQYSVDQYVLDFYCPELKLAIEVDGDSHFVTGAQEYDRDRQEYIESFGIRFLRFTNADVCENIDGVCQVIFNKIEKDAIVDGTIRQRKRARK
jgi:very-short-patch-repair endonuclease